MGLRYDYSMSIEQAIQNIYTEMILAVLRNFWMAIFEGMLSVTIGENIINRENLLSVMNEYFSESPDDSSKRITEYNPLPYLQMVINAEQAEKNHKKFILEAGSAYPDSRCVLYLQKKKTAKDRVLYMRSPRMLVKAETKRNRRGYYGVFVCTGGFWDTLLRSIENPAHNELDKDNYDGDKKTGLPKTNKDGSIKAKTSHTLNPVPCILYDNVTGGRLSLKEGSWGLSNLAATTANLLGFEKHESWDDSMLLIK